MIDEADDANEAINAEEAEANKADANKAKASVADEAEVSVADEAEIDIKIPNQLPKQTNSGTKLWISSHWTQITTYNNPPTIQHFTFNDQDATRAQYGASLGGTLCNTSKT